MVQWLRLHVLNAGAPSSIPGQGTISHMPQLRVHMPQLGVHMSQLKFPHASTKRSSMPQLKILHVATKDPYAAMKILHDATKTQCSEINK